MRENQTIATRIKEERRRLGLTQQQFADGLNISRSALTFYETARTVPDANFFSRAISNGVDIRYILVGERSAEAASYMLDWDLFGQIFVDIRQWCSENNVVLSTEKELAIAKLLYTHFSKRGLVDQDFVDQTMKLAA